MLKEEAGYLSPLFVFALNYESLVLLWRMRGWFVVSTG